MSERLGISSLSLSLILLALVVVAGVVAYNAWVMRRRNAGRRESAASAAVPRQADRDRIGEQAGSAARGEPSLGQRSGSTGSGVSTARRDSHPGLAGEPMLDMPSDTSHPNDVIATSMAADSSDGQAAPNAQQHPAQAADGTGAAPVAEGSATGARLHPLTDCIIEFQLAEPMPTDRLMATAHGFRRVGSKPVVIEFSHRETDEPGEPVSWSPIAARQRAVRLRVGVLLANRHGPLNAMEYSEFVTGVQALAEQLSVLGDTPDMNGVLQRARALDESCAALDAQVGLNVEAPDALGLADLSRLAQETGCIERGNNRHARLAEHGEVVFSLSMSDSPTRLSLLLDVPRSPLAANPWRSMVDCALHCAQRLGGRVVDDQGRPLSEASLQRIEEQLAERQQALSAAGLVPGSPLALRVFN